MVLGVAGALTAAVCYGIASVLQALGVRRVAEAPTQASRLARAWEGRWYAVGLLLDVVGFAASVASLQVLPLIFVQAAVAASIGVTAAGAAVVFGVRLARLDVVALLGVTVGLAGLGASATVQKAPQVSPVWQWTLIVAVLPLVVGAAWASSRHRSPRSIGVLASCAGLGFAGVGISARLLDLSSVSWHLIARPTVWALAGYGVTATVTYAVALARGSVTVVTALAVAIETVVPGLVGLVVLGDRLRPGYLTFALIGFVLVVGGCLALAGRPATTLLKSE
jgi:hypothetical protein